MVAAAVSDVSTVFESPTLFELRAHNHENLVYFLPVGTNALSTAGARRLRRSAVGDVAPVEVVVSLAGKVLSPPVITRIENPAGKPARAMEPRELAGHMASGVVAGTAVEAALYPIDTIKTRLQAARGGAAVSWRHLYKGLGGNLVGVVPACALFFAVYEPAKRALLPIPGDGDGEGTAAHHRRTAVAHLAAAASAGLASSLVRVPTEVVKTRMQTGQFSSARAALRHIVTKEGRLATGLFAGFGSFLLRDLPFDAIEFASYEQLKLAWCALAPAAPSSAAPSRRRRP